MKQRTNTPTSRAELVIDQYGSPEVAEVVWEAVMLLASVGRLMGARSDSARLTVLRKVAIAHLRVGISIEALGDHLTGRTPPHLSAATHGGRAAATSDREGVRYEREH